MTLKMDRLTRATPPRARPRRLRRTEAMRAMVRETRLSVDSLVEDARAVADLAIPALLLFGLPDAKDWLGSQAWAVDGIVQQAIRAIKRAVPSLLVIADTCLWNTPRIVTVEFQARTTCLA